uniref:Uncharacterized protein n=1 Tax=Ditylenchus dipsaci TaxID=166011 RepID=A0A915DUC7_9BILA
MVSKHPVKSIISAINHEKVKLWLGFLSPTICSWLCLGAWCYYACLLPTCNLHIPLEWTYPDTAFYMFKAIASTIMMFAAVVLYSDISFPFVMYCFGKIFARIDLKTDKI